MHELSNKILRLPTNLNPDRVQFSYLLLCRTIVITEIHDLTGHIHALQDQTNIPSSRIDDKTNNKIDGTHAQDATLSRSLSMTLKKMTFFIPPEEEAAIATDGATKTTAPNDVTKKMQMMELEMAALMKENNALKVHAETKSSDEDAIASALRITGLERELARSQGK